MAEPNSTLKTFWMLIRYGLVEIIGVGCGWVFYTLIGFFLNSHIVYRITLHSS